MNKDIIIGGASIVEETVNELSVGRLEVCRGSRWDTVSTGSYSGYWSQKNAQVACGQLGFDGALNSIPTNQYVVCGCMFMWLFISVQCVPM